MGFCWELVLKIGSIIHFVIWTLGFINWLFIVLFLCPGQNWPLHVFRDCIGGSEVWGYLVPNTVRNIFCGVDFDAWLLGGINNCWNIQSIECVWENQRNGFIFQGKSLDY